MTLKCLTSLRRLSGYGAKVHRVRIQSRASAEKVSVTVNRAVVDDIEKELYCIVYGAGKI